MTRHKASFPFPNLIFALTLVFWVFILAAQAIAQSNADSPLHDFWNQASDDPCGIDSQRAQKLLQLFGPGWGYGYDSLLTDLKQWQQNPYVQIDSVGASVQNRALWLLTITDSSPLSDPRIRIWIHARTHPVEVQGWWVTHELIKILLSETNFARMLRKKFIFNIMPMYNPDGVELGLSRENAHHVDIESNWNASPGEPEVQVLRHLFTGFMASEMPIRIALNMHSSYRCRRFFVYHEAAGTSPAFAEDQKLFIGDIRNYWEEGIENWDYFVSWKNGTPPVYPESWFWQNHREAVMALTYEDMNCPEAGEFDRTASALLRGMVDYLQVGLPTAVTQNASGANGPRQFILSQTYPNPIRRGETATLRFYLAQPAPVTVGVYDILGRQIKPVLKNSFSAGEHQLKLQTANMATGTYLLVFATPLRWQSQKLIILR